MAGIIGVNGKVMLDLKVGESFDLSSTRALLLSVHASSGFDLGVHVVKEDGSFVEIVGNSRIHYGNEAEGYICLYSSNNRIIVKNNMTSTRRLYFNVINL